MRYKIKSTWEGTNKHRLLTRYPCLRDYNFTVVKEMKPVSISPYFGEVVHTPYITINNLEELEKLRKITASNIILTVDGEIEIYNAPRER